MNLRISRDQFHTGHISIGGQDGVIEDKIRGISGQNRGQIGGKKGGFLNKIEGKINQNKGTHYFNQQDVWWLCHLTNSHPVKPNHN